MKKFLWMVAAIFLMFACSNDKENGNEPIAPESQVFELTAVNEIITGVPTRNRPLYSQEAIQEVERVSIYVFKKVDPNYTYLKTFEVTGWSKGSTFMRYTVADADKLEADDYTFLLVGREASDNFTLTVPVVGTTTLGDMLASVTSPGNESEIFAGTKVVTVSSQGVRVSMSMSRKVAGVLGYFRNVPAALNGTNVKYLRLTLTNAGTNVNLSTGTGLQTTGSEYMIFNADLSGQAVTTEGVFEGNDLSGQGVVKVTNSQLMGKFLLPIGTGAINMTLGLYDENGIALKTWMVEDNGNTDINILANHFYSLGKKVSKGDTTGGGTPDTGDDDAPVDLLKDQVVVINIDPSWNTLHDLTIE